LKFGGGVRMLQFNVRRLTQGSGEFDFDPSQTSSTGTATGVGGDAVASALFGLVNQAFLNYGAFSGVRYKDFYFFAQDSYKLTSRLTLNYGLRYDLDKPATEAFDRFSAVDPTLPNPGAGGILGAYTYFGTGTGRNGRTRPQDTYTKAFGPRLGFAYSINSKTVLRGGYGIFYDTLAVGDSVFLLGLNPPFVHFDVKNNGPVVPQFDLATAFQDSSGSVQASIFSTSFARALAAPIFRGSSFAPHADQTVGGSANCSPSCCKAP